MTLDEHVGTVEARLIRRGFYACGDGWKHADGQRISRREVEVMGWRAYCRDRGRRAETTVRSGNGRR